MEEKRRYVRTQVNLKVNVTHPVLGSVNLLTRDISDNGMFVIIRGPALLPIGEIVNVQVLDVVDHPPVCRMKVVRLENGGVGLMLCDHGS